MRTPSNLSDTGIYPTLKPLAALSHKLLFNRLLVICMCLGVVPMALQAYPVTFSVAGNFGSVISGTDPLKLSGTTFSMSGAIASNAPTPYVIPSLALTLSGTVKVTLLNVPVTIIPGNPATITIAATVVGQPFTATVNLSPGFTSSAPYPFGTQNIASGSTVTYGTPSTVLGLSGTISATTTAPTLTASPSSFSYAFTIGGSNPASQNLTVTSNGAAESFQAAAAASWVVVPVGGHPTGTPISISIDPTKISGIAAGTYNSSITITSTTGVVGPPNPIPVSLVVSAGLPTITPSPASLTFNYQL